jgi:hypothetical protein
VEVSAARSAYFVRGEGEFNRKKTDARKGFNLSLRLCGLPVGGTL